jgi:hypothetical protein
MAVDHPFDRLVGHLTNTIEEVARADTASAVIAFRRNLAISLFSLIVEYRISLQASIVGRPEVVRAVARTFPDALPVPPARPRDAAGMLAILIRPARRRRPTASGPRCTIVRKAVSNPQDGKDGR